jgi:hypothetical protein
MRRFGLLVAALAALVMADPAVAARPKIPADDLKAIQAMLHTWVPAVVGRHHPLDAYALATPALRSTTTRAQWGRGDIPVAPYPAGGGRYGIRPISVTPDDIIFDLMLQPRKGSDAGVVVYTTEVQRVDNRWLVASMYTTAQFAGPGEQRSITAEPDLGPHAQGVHQRQVLGSGWIMVLIGVILLPLIAAPIALLVVWRRNRAPSIDEETRARAAMPWR